MARPQRTKQLQDLIDDVNPITVATVVADYGIGAARERWHWCAHYVGEIAAEGRRMKAAGEKWTRAARPPEPEDTAPATKPVPWKPTFVPSSPAPAAKIPVPVPAVPAPDRMPSSMPESRACRKPYGGTGSASPGWRRSPSPRLFPLPSPRRSGRSSSTASRSRWSRAVS